MVCLILIKGIDNMEKQIESKIVTCRYGTEKEYLDDLKQFGWTLASKRILNRFGNPLPANERVSESDLREKCSYELTLNRYSDPETSMKLNALENEYNNQVLKQACFSGGRVTGMVFLSLAILILSIVSGSFLSTDASNSAAIALLVLDFLAIGGLIAIILTGAFSVANACKYNDLAREKRKQIAKEASKLIS